MASEPSADPDLTEEQRGKIVALRRRLNGVQDDDGFARDDDMLRRYLIGHNWSVSTACEMVKETLKWRAAERPGSWTCRWCIETPGYHSMRQIGFDRVGRPLFYSCFSQSPITHFTAEDNVAHVVFLLENAIRTMKARPGLRTPEKWLWVLDCTGMSMAACNPKLSTSVVSILSSHYPERLGCVFAVNAGILMRAAWAAMRVFLNPATAAKLCFPSDLSQLSETFDEETFKWIQTEVELNKRIPFPQNQMRFWEAPGSAVEHDPRGTRTYVSEYIEQSENSQDAVGGDGHCPHPNITLPKESPACSDV